MAPMTMVCSWLLGIFLGAIITNTEAAEVRVVCYYTNWSVYRPGTAKFSPQNINPYLCTHLIYAFGGFTKENTLKPFDKYQDIEKGGYAKFTGLKTYNKNLKTMIAIGGWNEGSARFSSLVANANRRREFVKNAVKFLRVNHFDGLDLDWEYPSFRDGGHARDRENYAQLVQELREEFNRETEKTGRPRLLLTMAVPAGIQYIEKGYDIEKLNKYLDWMNLLSYDYHSAFEPAVNHHSPLYPLEEENEYNFDAELNIDHTIKFYLEAGADRDKLVVGIPTYGRSYTLFNAEATEIGAPADGPGEMGDATKEKGYLAYYEICESLKEGDDWTVVQPNPKAMGPYAYKDNQWVGYDDEDIVRLKAQYVAEHGLGGIMFWAIDNDDFRGKCHGRPYPLIEAAKEALIESSGRSNVVPTSQYSKSARSRSRARPTASRPSAVRSNSGGRQGAANEPSATHFNSRGGSRFSVSAQSNQLDDSKPASRVRPNSGNRLQAGGRRRAANAKRRTTTTTTPTTTTTRRSSVLTTTPGYNTPEPPTTPDPGSDFKCEDEGFFPHPRDCKKYFWCLSSGPSDLGIVAHQFTCPAGLYFNKAADSCDYTRNVLCKKKSTTTTTSAPTNAPTTTTKAPPTTARTPARITAATSKTTFRITATSTTTTELPLYDDEYEYEDDADEFESPELSRDLVSEEDPRVIKELIDLIKKVGGIEELEKQLNLQSDVSAVTGTTSGGPSTTPPAISKSLYERVLSGRTTLKAFGRPAPTGRPQPVFAAAPKSRAGPQNDGLDKYAAQETSTRGLPEYVTINRFRANTQTEKSAREIPVHETIDYDTVNDADTSPVLKPKSSQSTQYHRPEYVVIQRSRPQTTTPEIFANGYIVEEVNNDEESKRPLLVNEKEYVSLRRARPMSDDTSTLKYHTIQRTRPTTENGITTYSDAASITTVATTTEEKIITNSPATTLLLAAQQSSFDNQTANTRFSVAIEVPHEAIESNTELTDALLKPLLTLPPVTEHVEIPQSSSTITSIENESTAYTTNANLRETPTSITSSGNTTTSSVYTKNTPALLVARPFALNKLQTSTEQSTTNPPTPKVSANHTSSSDIYTATRRRPLTPHGFVVSSGSTVSGNVGENHKLDTPGSFEHSVKVTDLNEVAGPQREAFGGRGTRVRPPKSETPDSLSIPPRTNRFQHRDADSTAAVRRRKPIAVAQTPTTTSERPPQAERRYRPKPLFEDFSSLTSVDMAVPAHHISEENRQRHRPAAVRRTRPTTTTHVVEHTEPTTSKPAVVLNKRRRPTTTAPSSETTTASKFHRDSASSVTVESHELATTPLPTTRAGYQPVVRGRRVFTRTGRPTDAPSSSPSQHQIADVQIKDSSSKFSGRRRTRFRTPASSTTPEITTQTIAPTTLRTVRTEEFATPFSSTTTESLETSTLTVTENPTTSEQTSKVEDVITTTLGSSLPPEDAEEQIDLSETNIQETDFGRANVQNRIINDHEEKFDYGGPRRLKVLKRVRPVDYALRTTTQSHDLMMDHVNTKVTTNQGLGATDANVIIRTRKIIRKLRPVTTTQMTSQETTTEESIPMPSTRIQLEVGDITFGNTDATSPETNDLTEEVPTTITTNEVESESPGTTSTEALTPEPPSTTKSPRLINLQNRPPYKPRRRRPQFRSTTETPATPEHSFTRKFTPSFRPADNYRHVVRPFYTRKPPAYRQETPQPIPLSRSQYDNNDSDDDEDNVTVLLPSEQYSSDAILYQTDSDVNESTAPQTLPTDRSTSDASTSSNTFSTSRTSQPKLRGYSPIGRVPSKNFIQTRTKTRQMNVPVKPDVIQETQAPLGPTEAIETHNGILENDGSTTFEYEQTTEIIRHVFADIEDASSSTESAAGSSRATNGVVGMTKHEVDVDITTSYPVYTKDLTEVTAEVTTPRDQNKLEKIIEVNRIVEVTYKENEKNQPQADFMLNAIPKFDRIGEINRLTSINVVDGNDTRSLDETDPGNSESLQTFETSGYDSISDGNALQQTISSTKAQIFDASSTLLPIQAAFLQHAKTAKKISIESHSRVANSFTVRPDFTEATTIALEALFHKEKARTMDEGSLPTLKQVLSDKSSAPESNTLLKIRLLDQDQPHTRALAVSDDTPPILPIRILEQDATVTAPRTGKSVRIVSLLKNNPLVESPILDVSNEELQANRRLARNKDHTETLVKYEKMGGFLNAHIATEVSAV